MPAHALPPPRRLPEISRNTVIVGGEIRAHAWELLLAMLVMEAAFGLSGLVAAPVFYAYVKRELVAQGWV